MLKASFWSYLQIKLFVQINVENLFEFLVEQREKSSDQQAESNDQRAESNNKWGKTNEQRATSEKFHLIEMPTKNTNEFVGMILTRGVIIQNQNDHRLVGIEDVR